MNKHMHLQFCRQKERRETVSCFFHLKILAMLCVCDILPLTPGKAFLEEIGRAY